MRQLTEDPVAYELLYGDFTADLGIYRSFAKDARRVLDCGSGTGRISFALANSASSVIGLESSASMIAFAKQRAKSFSYEGLSFLRGDFRHIPQSNYFDRVIVGFGSVNFLLSLDDLHSFFSSAYRSMKQGGRIIVELSTQSTYRAMIVQPKSYPLRELTRTPGNLNLEFPYFSVSVDSDYDAELKILRQIRHFQFFDEHQNLVKNDSLHWANKLFDIDEIREIAISVGFASLEKTVFKSVSNALDEQAHTIALIACR